MQHQLAMAACGALALSSLALLLVACSGAASTDLFEGAPAQNTSPTDPAPTTPPPTTPPATGAPARQTPPPGPLPPATDAGVDAAPPPPACTPEAEPNNDFDDATTLTTSLCGKIDGNNDVDFWRFVVPAGANGLDITHAEQGGTVSYRYYRNGLAMAIGDNVNAIPGAVYSIQVRRAPGSNGGDRPTYQLDVSFK